MIQQEVNELESKISKFLLENNIKLVNAATTHPDFDSLKYVKAKESKSVLIAHHPYSVKTGKLLFGRIYMTKSYERRDEVVLGLIIPVCNLLISTKGNYEDRRWEEVRLASIRVNRTPNEVYH